MRIFERPYYAFNMYFGGEHIEFYNFRYISSALYYVIITMSSVGYGDIIACTPIGRFLAMTSVVVGAFLLSLMVTLTTSWFNIDDQSVGAVDKMQKDSLAVDTIRTALQYNVARAKRSRLAS